MLQLSQGATQVSPIEVDKRGVGQYKEMISELEQLFQRLQQSGYKPTRPDFDLLSDLNREQLARFCDLWEDVSTEVRLKLVSELSQLTEESFEYSFDRVFQEMLDDRDAQVRHIAVQGLWECEDDSLAGKFLHMLEKDTDENVRAAVASGLGRFVYLAEMDELDPSLAMAIETALLTAIHNPDMPLEVRRRAVEAIGFSCNPEVPDIIRDAYQHEVTRMRVSALFAMGRSADRRWRKIILQELTNSDAEIRFEAVRAAGELELSEAVEPLARVLDTEQDVQIRQAAVWSLGQIGGKVAKRVLEHIIAREEATLYEVAQDALEELSLEAEYPEIIDLLQSVESEGFDEALDEMFDEWDIWDEDELTYYPEEENDLLDDDLLLEDKDRF